MADKEEDAAVEEEPEVEVKAKVKAKAVIETEEEPEITKPENATREGVVYEEGLIKGVKPKGTRRYVWLGEPTKLHIKAIPHPKTGHLVLKRGDQVDLTRELKKRHAHYIDKGFLVPVSDLRKAGGDIEDLPKPPRRSAFTDKRHPK